MYKIISTITLSLLYFTNFSQSSIRIYTELKDETAQFMVWLNEEPQDAYPSDEVIIKNILPGKYTLQVSFNSDTIADWTKIIRIKKNEKFVYKVIKLKEISREIGKVGRSIGRITGKTKDNGVEDLIQYYKLEKQN